MTRRFEFANLPLGVSPKYDWIESGEQFEKLAMLIGSFDSIQFVAKLLSERALELTIILDGVPTAWHLEDGRWINRKRVEIIVSGDVLKKHELPASDGRVTVSFSKIDATEAGTPFVSVVFEQALN